MRRGTICGYIYVGGLQFLLVHPRPIEPDSWLKPDQQMFLVTYPGEQQEQQLEVDGLIKSVKLYTPPFHVVVNSKDVIIVLDRLTEVIFNEREETDE